MIRLPRLSHRRRSTQGAFVPAAIATSAAGRRRWQGQALMVVGTLAVAVTSYSLSQAVATERRTLRELAAANAALATTNRALAAELRVRMRLPQLQSWNDGIFGLLPITGEQHIQTPLELARFAMPPAPVAGQPTLAVLTREAPPAAGPRLVSAPLPAAPALAPPAMALPAAAPEPRPTAALRPAPTPPAAAPHLVAAAPASQLPPPLPADLLRLIEADAPPAAP